MAHAILTDARGVPFARPEKPAPDAPIDQVVAYLRALATYNDAVSDCGNRSFARAFSAKIVKK